MIMLAVSEPKARSHLHEAYWYLLNNNQLMMYHTHKHTLCQPYHNLECGPTLYGIGLSMWMDLCWCADVPESDWCPDGAEESPATVQDEAKGEAICKDIDAFPGSPSMQAVAALQNISQLDAHRCLGHIVRLQLVRPFACTPPA